MSMDTLFVVKKNVGVIEIQTGRLRGRLVNQDVDDKCCERTNTKSEATLRGKCLLTLFILLSQHFKAQKKKKRCDKQTRKWRPRKEKYPTTSGLTSKVEGLPWLKKGELRRQTGKGSGGKSACVGERKICVCVCLGTQWRTRRAHISCMPGPAQPPCCLKHKPPPMWWLNGVVELVCVPISGDWATTSVFHDSIAQLTKVPFDTSNSGKRDTLRRQSCSNTWD